MQNERPEAVEAVARALSRYEHGDEGEWELYTGDAQAALAAARAAQCEYICKCGLRVEPHRCRDTKGEF